MQSIAVLLALSGLAAADFYWAVGVRGTPPVCVGVTGCIPEPASYINQAVTVDQYDCGVLEKLPGQGNGNIGDPVCGTGPDSFGMPSIACGDTLDAQGNLFFRRQPGNEGFLDAARDEDFTDIVASCHKKPDCGDYGAPSTNQGSCDSLDSWVASFLCEPVNGSKLLRESEAGRPSR